MNPAGEIIDKVVDPTTGHSLILRRRFENGHAIYHLEPDSELQQAFEQLLHSITDPIITKHDQ